MGKFTVGDVVVISFPFSNLASSKKRPALVLAIGDYGNPVLCQITSTDHASQWGLKLSKSTERTSGLLIDCYARVDKLFTADPEIIDRKLGSISTGLLNESLLLLGKLFKNIE